jgi:PKD repeat protein
MVSSPAHNGARTPAALVAVVGMLVALTSGCAVQESPMPSPTAPSTLAMSVTVSASPITLLQNGVDSSVISVSVTDAGGRPVATDLSSSLEVAGVPSDFGSVTPRVARSNASTGIAQFTYTAPRAGIRAAEEEVTIVVTPESGGLDTATPRRVSVRVMPAPRTGPRTFGPLVAAFAVTPLTISAGTLATFDASSTRSGDTSCGTDCQFEWDFGDGARATGLTSSHAYSSPGNYTATLSVRDADGAVASISALVVVTAQPTAVFIFSPTPVGTNQDVFLNASQSRAVAGRRLVSYDWSFGDGTTGSGVTVTHRFTQVGTYTVLLTVADDGRGVANATQAITVTTSSTAPTAVVTFSPQSPRVGTTVFFNASGSIAGTAPITSYRFNYGDGTQDTVGSSPTQSHVFTAAATYNVRLTVTDELGRTGTITTAVTVVP